MVALAILMLCGSLSTANTSAGPRAKGLKRQKHFIDPQCDPFLCMIAESRLDEIDEGQC